MNVESIVLASILSLNTMLPVFFSRGITYHDI